MEYATLPTADKIPLIGLGTWRLYGKECTELVKLALKLGYTHIDTAEMYENEEAIGKAITGFDRKKLFITSKVLPSHGKYDQVIEACKESLRELKLDYLDLYLIHWRTSDLPLKEAMEALNKLVDDGLVRNIGVSNFSVEDMKEAQSYSKAPIATNQIMYNPTRKQEGSKEVLDFCQKNNIILTAWSPIDKAKSRLLDLPIIVEIAKKHDKTPAQICLRWLIQQKNVITIPKSSSAERLKENLDVFEWKLSEEDMNKINNISN